ncbi:MAG: ribosomal protein methylthiotransferase RimO [Actinomycetota bacterium]|jgi:ribosomal protein S12 methylthiotransferase RimO
MTSVRRVHLQTLGCARNETDSAELAGRLAASGWQLVEDPNDADAVVVNTCGFIESARKDSIDALLSAADLKSENGVKAVVAVGCMAERYGNELAADLSEADAVLGFDEYENFGDTLAKIIGGVHVPSHQPQDRRLLTAASPALRQSSDLSIPGHASNEVLRVRLDSKPYAPLKLASGCDRRCTFCAIPRFRGSYVSRRPTDIIAEAVWLAERGVKELFLVSENTTSYGKDLGDMKLLETLLPTLTNIDGVERVRVSYLQPAEMRPSLIEAMATTDKVAPYFDLSFQHASSSVLRSMRRFGGPDEFLALVESIRKELPDAGIRSNFIVGFPGETDSDFATLCDFVEAAQLDAVGIFGYSDEADTEALTFEGKISQSVIHERVEDITTLAEEIAAQRAEDRVGTSARVIIESRDGEGRTEFQGPEVDGITTVSGDYAIGDVVDVTIVESDGIDLVAKPC